MVGACRPLVILVTGYQEGARYERDVTIEHPEDNVHIQSLLSLFFFSLKHATSIIIFLLLCSCRPVRSRPHCKQPPSWQHCTDYAHGENG